MSIFSLSLTTEIFLDRMKVAKVTPIFQKGEKRRISNYRPIYFFPFSSKILERIMYSRLSKQQLHLTVNNNLFNKQFEHRAGHSTEDAFLEEIDLIYDSFNDKKYFLGIFIDLSKAFSILLNFEIKARYLSWS